MQRAMRVLSLGCLLYLQYRTYADILVGRPPSDCVLYVCTVCALGADISSQGLLSQMHCDLNRVLLNSLHSKSREHADTTGRGAFRAVSVTLFSLSRRHNIKLIPNSPLYELTPLQHATTPRGGRSRSPLEPEPEARAA